MITQPEIEVAIFQICNRLGMNAVLPSENMVIQAWKELAYGKQSKNSIAESLEQITWMEAGIKIGSIRTVGTYISIDTENDLKKAIKYSEKYGKI